MAKTYKLFISHIGGGNDDVLKDLKSLLDSRDCFYAEYTQIEKTFSIESDNAGIVKVNITKHLKESDVVLAISGIDSNCEWMQWELNKAKELGLNIIGVIPPGQEHTSNIIFNLSVIDVCWNADSLVDAIRKYSR